MSALETALAYIERGWAPVPVPFREKAPVLPEWQKLAMTRTNAAAYFNGQPQNVSILLGTPSGGLTDGDMDCAEARELAPQFLPPTLTFGRAGAPCSHWLFVSREGEAPTLKFTDPTANPDNAMLLELRSSKHQTVFPGSVHVSGEAIEWHNATALPTTVENAALVRAFRKLAAAALLLRHWNRGARDEVAKNLIGCMLRANWSADDANSFVSIVAAAAGDEELHDRLKAERIETWEHKPGLPSLRDVLDTSVVDRLAEWLELRPAALDPAHLLAELNAKHAVVWDGPKLRILHETYDPVLKLTQPSLIDRSHLQAFYENQPLVAVPSGDKVKHVNQIDWWMEQPGRRLCKGFVLDPECTDPDVHNLWAGYAYPPSEHGSCDLYLAHVRDNIANGDTAIFNYLFCWMADAVQRPTIRPGVAVVLRGPQGSGKGVFVGHFGRLYGRHYVHVQSSDQFLGRFNKHLGIALLLFADEAVWAGDKRAEGKLKGLITEPEVLIEAKFVDARPMPNHLRVMVASNHDWVVPAGLDERRMFILDVGEGRTQDSTYFGAIIEQLRNGGYQKLLHTLLHHDLSGVDLRKFPPTPALLEQKISSMEPEVRFLYDIARDGMVPGDVDGNGRTIKKIFYRFYVAYTRNLGKNYRLSPEQLGLALRRLLPELREEKPHRGGRVYIFPPLSAVRQLLDQKMRQPVPWDDTAGWETDYDTRNGQGVDGEF